MSHLSFVADLFMHFLVCSPPQRAEFIVHSVLARGQMSLPSQLFIPRIVRAFLLKYSL